MISGLGYDFFDTIPQTQSTTQSMDKLDFITKIKHLCSVKDSIKRIERQATGQGKYLQKAYLIRTAIQNLQRILKTHQ